MIMKKNFKILSEFIKDMSSETPDVQTYLFVKENIKKYHLNIDINSKALKRNMIEIYTTLKFEDKNESEKKSYFEIVYATIIRIEDDAAEKKQLEKIILCDVQNLIYPRLENAFVNLLTISGHPSIKFEKKIDFEKLYNERLN